MKSRSPRRLLAPTFYRTVKWLSLLSVPAVVAVFGTIGYNLSPRFYWGMGGAAIPLAAYVFSRGRQRIAEIRLRARRRWGTSGTVAERPSGREEGRRRASYLAWTREESEGPVDDRTWADLGMDDVTMEMDVCFTDAGQNELFRMLHHCLVPEAEAEARARLTEAVVADQELRDFLLPELSAVGQERDADPASFLWAERVGRDQLAPLFIGMGAAAVLSLAAPFILPVPAALALIAAVFVVNMWLYYTKARHLSSLVPSLRVLSRLLQAAANVAAHTPALPGVDVEALRGQTAMVGRLRRPFRWLLTGSPGGVASISGDIFEVIFLYLKIFFLVDLIAFDRISRVISRDPEGVRALYRFVGRLDALHAVASYRVLRPRHCRPELVPGAGLDADGLYHPLVRKAVRNGVSIARPGAVITGTNMAGKSTLLRTLGVNAILAQTTGVCFARSYRADRFLVMSSIERHDDLGSGKSFYYDEAERIFRMIERVGDGPPVLLLIDELLSGTNSLERESASVAILHFLARRNALTVAATHDITIASRLQKMYPTFYFTDHADEKGLSFDYKMRPGIVQTRNAIKLLSIIGYPDDVIQEALKGAEQAG